MPTGVYTRTAKYRAQVAKTRTGTKLTAVTRAKISKSMIGNQRRLGTKHSAATRAKISKANIGRVLSAEHCAKISRAMMGNQRRLGHKASAETLAKMSKAQAGKIVSTATRAKISATLTGRTCAPFTQEHRDKISRASTGNQACLGRKISHSTRSKIGASNTGRPVSDETRKRMSKASTGRSPSDAAREKQSAQQIRMHNEKPILVARAKKLRADGLTGAEIGRILDISSPTIVKWLKETGTWLK